MKTIVFGLLCFPALALGSPFLICDPYPATGTPPTEFVVTISGVSAPVVTPAVAVTGGVAMRLDLGPLNLSGSKTLTAKARNSWGESSASAPFQFAAGSPGAPGGLGLSAQ